MINENFVMTLENEIAKKHILANYKHDGLSIAYGSFHLPNGYFNFGNSKDNKYIFFWNLNSINNNIELKDLSPEEIDKALEKFGLEKINNKIETQIELKLKEEKTQFTLFDFMEEEND